MFVLTFTWVNTRIPALLSVALAFSPKPPLPSEERKAQKRCEDKGGGPPNFSNAMSILLFGMV